LPDIVWDKDDIKGGYTIKSIPNYSTEINQLAIDLVEEHICGKLSRSSFVNTDLNCSFNASAFPLLFSMVSPFTFSVDTPTVSLRRSLEKVQTI
jgi:hypothetical protein